MSKTTKNGWLVNVPADAGMVLKNAGEELADFLSRRLQQSVVTTTAGSGRITLGTAEMPTIRALLGDKPLGAGKESRRTRRIVRQKSGEIIIVGSDERAVLDGVFSLEDWMWQGELPAECDKTWSDAFVSRNFVNYIGEAGRVNTRAEMRTCARQGCTHFAVNMITNTDDGSQFHKVVVPTVLPVKHDLKKIQAVQQRTRELISLMTPWGMKPFFYMCEPFTGGNDDTAIPAEVKGRRFVNWMNQEVPTLCIRHPKVQEHYRALVHDFCRTYPEVDTLNVYMDDGDYWFCGPTLCPLCRPHAEDLNARHPMENYVVFANLLQRAAKEVRPDFSVGMVTIHIEDEIEAAAGKFLKELEPGITLIHVPHHFDGVLCHQQTAAEWRNWNWLAKPAKKRGVRMMAWDEFTNSESIHTVRTLPTVQTTATKLDAYARHKVENLWVEAPNIAGLHNPVYTAWRLMVTGEITDAVKAVAEAVRRSYGRKAAPAMMKALGSLEKGLEVFYRNDLPLKLYARWVLCLRPPRLMGVAVTPADLNQALKKGFFVIETNGAKTAAVRHHLPELLTQSRLAEPHFVKATALAGQAVRLAKGSKDATSVALDHPLLASRTVGDLAEETLLALRLWQGLFTMWVNRMEAVQLYGVLRVHAEEPLPNEASFRRNIQKPGKRLIELAREDARNLRTLAGLVRKTPDSVPHVIKWERDSENPNAPYAQTLEETAIRTEAFLKDPWAMLNTLWMM